MRQRLVHPDDPPRRVQRAKEGLTGVGEGLPGVLAVEDDRQRAVALHVAQQVARGGLTVPARVLKPDAIRQAAIAEDHAQLGALDHPCLAKIGRAVALAALKHALVGGQPAQPALSGDLRHLGAHAALAGPHAAGPTAEHDLGAVDALGDLAARVVGVGEAHRVGQAGHAALGVAEVDEQREDRVVVGRDRGVAVLAPQRQHGGDDLILKIHQINELTMAEPAVLQDHLGDQLRSARHHAHPGEVAPDLEVAERLGFGQPRGLGLERPVAGRLPPHRGVPVNEAGADEFALLFAQVFGWHPRHPRPSVGAAGGVALELIEQGRHHVEGGPRPRFERQGGRVGVAAERVKAHPRHDRLAGEGAPVVGLVHVQEQGDFGAHSALYQRRGRRGREALAGRLCAAATLL